MPNVEKITKQTENPFVNLYLVEGTEQSKPSLPLLRGFPRKIHRADEDQNEGKIRRTVC